MLVDEVDYELVSAFSWSCFPSRNTFYGACTQIPIRGMLAHRFIMKPPVGLVVDHINRNGLDNRRSNLRVVTVTENNWNVPPRAGRRSEFRGVVFEKRQGNYYAKISVDGKKVHLGTFPTEEEAARAFDFAAKQYRGQFAQLNFPEGRES